LKALLIVLGFVALEVLLNLTHCRDLELVEAKFKVNKSVVNFEAFEEGLSNFFIKAIIRDIQTAESRVVFELLNEEEHAFVVIFVCGQVVVFEI